VEPYDTGFIKVGDGHELYYEQVGNPTGPVIVFLHGGPGGGVDPSVRRFFDAKHYRVVLFDQRGAGKSRPNAGASDEGLYKNTTDHLVTDIETIRQHLGIDKWVVFGGSWGSTLALAYAEAHPTQVKGLILRGIFGCRRKELLWMYQEGASFIYPDEWEKYLSVIPEVERGDLLSAYHRRLMGTDEKEKVKCAKAWTGWEMVTSRLYLDREMIQHGEEDDFAKTFARIENHYFVYGAFLKTDAQLFEEAHKLRHIPGIIIQGRYDLVCPAYSAWELHRQWPEAELVFVDDSGHSAREPGILSELVKATDKFRSL